jgi:Ca2+/Na+ antiporter
MTHWPIFIEFAALSLMIGGSGYFLSLYGDVIAEKTGLGGTWVGLAMLATVTSLPELVTRVSAVTYAGVPNIALGDALGSCVFNLLLIVLLDFLHREASVYTRVSQGHILSAGFGVVLLGFVAFNIVLFQHQSFVGTVFVALATSLPEVAVTLSALRIGALDMAISDLLGSNLFDLVIIAVDDLVYLDGPLLANVSPVHLMTILSAIMMTGIAIVGLLYRPQTRLFKTVGLGQPVHVRHLHP